ncbi:tail fiber protein [Labilibaculum euxinus]|uniref:Phage tail collar domain-containing protein n=1 Tax=Labilibaculum euxinus TaxID=2686357 RepID=A0A7M4D9U0_9BACT|nr:tail fiber protein [Labilibaculum euxinus]MUP39419.1 hypothetical protein [Labilibaculum euxinus]MVB08624.1 hypothetical protein [Labilibaculum euxinus]
MIKFYSSLLLSFVLLLGTQITQAQQNKQDIKNHFQNGYAPGAVHFGYLIDACYNYSVGQGLIYDSGNNLIKAEVPLSLLEQNLRDTAQNIRIKIDALQSGTNTTLNKELSLLKNEVRRADAVVLDTVRRDRANFQKKLADLEYALQDSNNDIKSSLNTFYDALNQKIELGDNNLSDLIKDTENKLKNIIDSLADAHNIDRVIQENRMTEIENNYSVLQDTVVEMKIKLDTLNFSEENFTQTLRLKLDNIEDGATRADNNFTDALKTKLDGIENNANNYQLARANHNKMGGVQLSSEFLLFNEKLYTTLNPNNIDRQYAQDTISGVWNSKMESGDVWTRVRYKMENGSVDAENNKLYDYGEWNQAYKFIYDDLENSFYEFNATDSLNVILGIHEKDKFFTGKNNTIIGHNAGYTLYKGGERNVAIGNDAGRGSAYVSDNVFIGSQAGESIGNPSQSASVNGDFSSERNVALGTKAMQGRNASGKSVAIGYSAMELGEQNSSVAIGYNAASNNSGTNNIAIGCEAGLSVPGSSNTSTIAIGYRAGYKNTYAKHNIFIGDSSALINESGEKNIFIGHGTGKSNTGNGNLFIGNAINVAGNDKMAIGNKGNILISGNFITNTVSINKLTTANLTVGNSISNSYSIANKEVINNSSQFVGEGGVNTSAQIKSTYANAKGNANVAISAPNGTVFGKYISGSNAILIGNTDVINNTGTFIGSGGVNTSGDINAKNIKGSEALEIAGLSIVKLSGGIPVERYALKSHNHSPSDINTNSTNRFVTDADKLNWNNKANKSDLSSNDYTAEEKSKLTGIEDGANKCSHPDTLKAAMIVPDAGHNFVSETEKASWNDKAEKNHTHIVGGTIPLGGIIMWSGKNIPSGWALCNGQVINGITTPNLSDRFVVGSGTTYTTNDRGGNKSVKLELANLPSHSHGAGTLKLSDNTLSDFLTTNNNTLTDNKNVSKGVVSKTIAIQGSTASAGSSNPTAVDITPYYYALAFIMRVE